MSDLAGTLMERLTTELEAARDRERAAGMEAYMRDLFPFFGLPAPARRARARTALTGLPRPSADDLRAVALACWERDEREFQQFACDYLVAHAAVPGPEFLDTVARLITTKSWWDSVDPLATRVVGGLVRRHPALAGRMDEWSRHTDMWLVRTAVLHQLHYGSATDTDRLFGYCAAQAGHPDFFVRKAIGWALRQYARTDPGAVRVFLAEHAGDLSPLSVREASKHL
ncbi:DNA alkylation repair protein [Actinoplanes sp. DH11]|uniref:DNA alkylation repair protein n=1 Tax=Actinoplanes sp. DH11 TaxID=2857011 RepID=UPI001E4BC492|nr:DNA alkylation repair protein [Actinoplanes sp. DH11]